MTASQRSRGSLIADETASSTMRVRCPGRAHGSGEPCIICDEEDDGCIWVVVTEVELAALGGAAQGRAVDRRLAPRLRMLGLLHEVGGYSVPTEEGFALLGTTSHGPN
jgi:hypothetical protein